MKVGTDLTSKDHTDYKIFTVLPRVCWLQKSSHYPLIIIWERYPPVYWMFSLRIVLISQTRRHGASSQGRRLWDGSSSVCTHSPHLSTAQMYFKIDRQIANCNCSFSYSNETFTDTVIKDTCATFTRIYGHLLN